MTQMFGWDSAAQLLQNRDVSIFSEWHFGHSIISLLPSFLTIPRKTDAAEQRLEAWVAA